MSAIAKSKSGGDFKIAGLLIPMNRYGCLLKASIELSKKRDVALFGRCYFIQSSSPQTQKLLGEFDG
jgi:hypothetical protein